MIKHSRIVSALALVVAAGCGKGKDGASGATGVPGPVGPISAPPQIASVQPTIASSASIVEVRGSGFSSLPLQNRVLVDGTPVTVLTATSGSLLTIAGLPAAQVGQSDAALTVEVQGRASNAFPLQLAPAGSERAAAEGGLVAPRSLAVDSAGRVLVFDVDAGVLRLDPATGALEPLVPAGTLVEAPQAGAVAPDGTLAIADGTRVVKVAADGTVQAIATGLASAPTAMVYDAAGNLYLAENVPGGTIDRIAPDGTLVHPFVQVPTSAEGLALLGGALYVSGFNTPGSGQIHKISLPSGSPVPSFVQSPALDGVRGLSAMGADLVACVPDSGGAGAVRIDVGTKAVTAFAPARPLAGAASSGCVAIGSTLWSVSTVDGGIDSTDGAFWTQRAASLESDASAAAVFGGDRLFLAATDRCNGAGTGAVVESQPGGASVEVLDGLCPVGIAWDGARLLVVDSAGGDVTAVDPGSPTTSSTPVPAGPARGYGIAATLTGATQSGFYLALSSTPPRVAHESPSGAELQTDVFAAQIDGPITGVAASVGAGTHVFAASADGVWAVGVDATGAPVGSAARLVGAQQGFDAISTLVSDGANGAWFLDSGEVYDVDPTGAIRWVGDVPSALALSPTPWGELLYTIPGSGPVARLQ